MGDDCQSIIEVARHNAVGLRLIAFPWPDLLLVFLWFLLTYSDRTHSAGGEVESITCGTGAAYRVTASDPILANCLDRISDPDPAGAYESFRSFRVSVRARIMLAFASGQRQARRGGPGRGPRQTDRDHRAQSSQCRDPDKS